MPYGLRRFQQAESLHFITFSCFHRLPYLATPESKDRTEEVLERTRSRHEARIYAYIFMPEHIHLLMNEPPRILVGQFLKSLKQTTSRHLRGEREQFWQSRYFDANIRGEQERTDVIRYIHRNPVKAASLRPQRVTDGAASTTTRPGNAGPSRSNRNGPQTGGKLNHRQTSGDDWGTWNPE